MKKVILILLLLLLNITPAYAQSMKDRVDDFVQYCSSKNLSEDEKTSLNSIAKDLKIKKLFSGDAASVKKCRRIAKKVGESNRLEVMFDPLPSLKPIGMLPANLVFINLTRGQITLLEGIERLTTLEGVQLKENNITDLSPLTQLPKLKKVYINDNPNLSDLSPLASVTSLQDLIITNTAVSDLSPIAYLPKLEQLRYNSDKIKKTPQTCPTTPNAFPALWQRLRTGICFDYIGFWSTFQGEPENVIDQKTFQDIAETFVVQSNIQRILKRLKADSITIAYEVGESVQPFVINSQGVDVKFAEDSFAFDGRMTKLHIDAERRGNKLMLYTKISAGDIDLFYYEKQENQWKVVSHYKMEGSFDARVLKKSDVVSMMSHYHLTP